MIETINARCIKHSRKQYICDLCGEPINVGDSYTYQFNKEDGETFTFRCHDYCEYIMYALVDDYIYSWDGVNCDNFRDGCVDYCNEHLCKFCQNCDKDNPDNWDSCTIDQKPCYKTIYEHLRRKDD